MTKLEIIATDCLADDLARSTAYDHLTSEELLAEADRMCAASRGDWTTPVSIQHYDLSQDNAERATAHYLRHLASRLRKMAAEARQYE